MFWLDLSAVRQTDWSLCSLREQVWGTNCHGLNAGSINITRLWSEWHTIMAVSVFSGEALTCDEVSVSPLCSLSWPGSPFCSCFKNNTLPCSCRINMVDNFCQFWCSVSAKAEILARRAGRHRRLVLSPERFHYPVASLKGRAAWRYQISQIWSTVWVEKRSNCVFSRDRWAYYVPECVCSLCDPTA